MRPLLESGRIRLGDTLCTDEGRAADVKTGARVVVEEGFRQLAGARLGLIVNQTSRVGARHLSDLAAASGAAKLVGLFSPEHGLRGEVDAGEDVADGRDPRTGVPVHSLFGATHSPTADMLQDIDALVFDIQDVGARFYTYISTMGLAMQAAAGAGIRFVVLDRPNPLGGDYVSGFVMRSENRSFVGQYPIPITHGMTVGELAAMIKGEAMLDGLETLDLDVVAMRGWRRTMQWPLTGLEWIIPSPAIVDFETALVYAGMGLFEATATNYGRGTPMPFRLIGAPWVDAARLAGELTRLGFPGLGFEAVRFTPRGAAAGAFAPLFAGRELPGVKLTVREAESVRPVEAGLHILGAVMRHADSARQKGVIDKPDWLARISGSGSLAQDIAAGRSAEEIIASWRDEVHAFKKLRAPYLLYQ